MLNILKMEHILKCYLSGELLFCFQAEEDLTPHRQFYLGWLLPWGGTVLPGGRNSGQKAQ
jgi:hypothetical protein